MSYKVTQFVWGRGPQPTEVLYGPFGNPAPGTVEDNVFSFTLLEGEGKKILVDCGMDAEGRAIFDTLQVASNPPEAALALAGVKPEDIDVVILTHAHMDHMGGCALFPNAQFYIQEEDFSAWEEMLADQRYMALTLPAVFQPDFDRANALIDEGRMTLLNGDVLNFLPGIDIMVCNECHSVAEQVVLVETEKGTFAICGDLTPRKSNMVPSEAWPGFRAAVIGRSGAARLVFAAYEAVLDAVDGDIDRVVVTHDVCITELDGYHAESESLGYVVLA